MRRWLRQPWVVPLTLTIAGWLWMLSGERAAAQAQLAAFADRVAVLQVNNADTRERIARMDVALAAIETDVRWMRRALEHLRDQIEKEDQ